ncbi:MAG TPA: hypothetical protein GXX36_12920 [Clostridiaceae bacterium]|nr:hypothetical protein [Clostridiaceae bacterium]
MSFEDKNISKADESILQKDWRNIANGYEIPREGYCDQPYVVITDDGNWLCVLTTGKGEVCFLYLQ